MSHLDWMTIDEVCIEAAALMRSPHPISRHSVYRWIRKGRSGQKLPAKHRGRYGAYQVRRCWLADFIESFEDAADEPNSTEEEEASQPRVLSLMDRVGAGSHAEAYERLDSMFGRIS